MCSRFEQKVRAKEVARRFGLTDTPPLVNTAEVRPTDQALVITTVGNPNGNSIIISGLMAWGFEVPWDSNPLINARSETLSTKTTFQDKLEYRCIIPASAYYEWRKDDCGKYKNTISVEGQESFSMAGLIDNNHFIIITCPSVPDISHIHNRMPVILSGEAEQAWINSELTFDDVRQNLFAFNAGALKVEEDVPPAPAQRDLFD